jgi:hypothetical protein
MNKIIKSLSIAGAMLMPPLVSAAIDTSYVEDFETCNIDDENAVGFITSATCAAGAGTAATPGFVNFVNGYDPLSPPPAAPIFFYGPNPSPNNAFNSALQMTGIATSEGGAAQGNNQLNTFSNYADPVHTDGSGTLLEVNNFKEFTIGSGDLGKTFRFTFDYKRGTLAAPSTARAFIKVIEAGTFFLTGEAYHDILLTGPADWQEGVSIDLFIDPTTPVGSFFQVGFQNTSSNSGPTGVFYDNLSVTAVGACVPSGPDSDGDGIADNCDNCINVANAAQRDTDSDGHGNFCDADFDNACAVGFPDLTTFSNAFFSTDPLVDLDGDGSVGFPDLTIFSNSFFGVPGPSGVDIVPAPACNP